MCIYIYIVLCIIVTLLFKTVDYTRCPQRNMIYDNTNGIVNHSNDNDDNDDHIINNVQ